MALTGEEIRARLSRFAAHWTLYAGGERSEAQTFLNELLECYGTDRRTVAKFEAPQEGRFLDMLWPGACIIEMKAPAQANRLSHHRKQAIDYWQASAKGPKLELLELRIRWPRENASCLLVHGMIEFDDSARGSRSAQGGQVMINPSAR